MTGAKLVESLIDQLIRTGRHVDEKLAVQILDRKEEAVPYLINIVKSDKYWRSEDECLDETLCCRRVGLRVFK
jgi:hypothetical protein